MSMELVNAMMSNTEDRQIRRALLPILSIIRPKNGLVTADMMYGIPNMYPAVILSNPYFY